MSKILSEMHRRTSAYEAAKAKGLAAGDPDEALYWFYFAATIAWLYPFDRWCDADIDASLEKLSSVLGPAATGGESHRDSLVHLTSATFVGGGHTEVLLFWTECVGTAIVSSEWDDPQRIKEAELVATTLPIYRCPLGLRPSEKVLWIFNKLAETRPGKLVLHINPNDAVALAACLIYRRTSGSEIVLHDHADTFFWLGASLLDRVIEFRPVGASIAHLKRGIPSEKISLVSLTSRNRNSPEVTRASLGLPHSATVSLTVAAYYKMRPDGYWDYPRTINRILEQHPFHYHLVVGHGKKEDEASLCQALKNQRVLWLGHRNDIDELLRASDFVIESFPLMGGTLRLDALRAGKPVVAVSHPAWPLIFDTGAFPSDYAFVAASNEEVAALSAAFIRDSELRAETGARLQAHFKENFSHEVVERALKEALGGKVFKGGPAEPLVYDPMRVTNLLNRGRLNLLTVRNMAETDLCYVPPESLLGRVKYLAGYTREALKRRLKWLRSRLNLEIGAQSG
ncbi:MAG: glycosyltransferase [Pyrinomonadaceae bacterium]